MQERWVVLLLFFSQVLSLREQKFAVEPQDQTAVVGSRVTLPCRVINKSGLLQWTQDGFGLGNLSGFDRYSIIGVKEEGNHTLQIYPVALEDDGIYRCQVGAGEEGEAPIISKQANLSVLVPPEPPVIVQGSHLLTTEGRHIDLECVSANGKPPAEVMWVDGNGNVLRDGIQNTVEPLPSQKTFTSRSVLSIITYEDYHNMTLTCQSRNSADHAYRSASILLHVKYAPKVRVKIVGNGTRLMEGQDVHLSCLATANPPAMTYRWFINDQLVLGNPTTELVIKNVSQRHHNSVVKCEVYNEVGRNEERETLDVSYSPRFRMKPYSVQADIGASVTLSCDVDGNPTPNIVWIREDSARVVSTSSNLTLTVTQESAGRYFCRATVPGFRDIKAEATVYMKGPPTVISHRTQYGIPGDDVLLECSAFSIPKPQKVVWSFRGEDVGSDLDYNVLEEQLAEGIKSTLVIQNSQMEHFGVYNCTVYNPYGSDEVEITLKAQKSFPLHTTIFGVMGGIVVLVSVTALYMMCQRKPTKPSDYNMDVTKNLKLQRESDRSSTLSDLKLDLEYGREQLSESGSENALEGTCLPLAGPVPLDQRYSQCYSITEFRDPGVPQRNDGQNNNGYVPYVEYSTVYGRPSTTPLPAGVSPVPYTQPSTTPLPAGVSPVPDPGSETVDPRYSAIYGNPYLKHPVIKLPPPPAPHSNLPSPPTPHSNLPPPPYNIMRNTINRNVIATHV